MSSKVKCP